MSNILENLPPRFQRYAKPVLVVASVVLCYSIYVWSVTETTDNAYIEADISNVGAQVSGVIAKVLVEDHVSVKEGDIIAEIESDNYVAHVQKAQAAIDMAKCDIDMIEQEIRIANIEQKKARQLYEFSTENFSISNLDYKRVQELSKDNYATRKSLDDSKIMLEKNKNELAQALLSLEALEAKIDSLEIKKEAAQAKYRNNLAEYSLALRDVSNTKIRAPISGIIANSALREGIYVRPGVILFSIVPNDNFYVQANFKETQIAGLSAGVPVKLTLDSYKGYNIEGRLRNIAPATGAKFSLLPPSNTTGNFTKIVQKVPVIIDFTVPEELKGQVFPGMSVIVKIRK